LTVSLFLIHWPPYFHQLSIVKLSQVFLIVSIFSTREWAHEMVCKHSPSELSLDLGAFTPVLCCYLNFKEPSVLLFKYFRIRELPVPVIWKNQKSKDSQSWLFQNHGRTCSCHERTGK
jgi:hypothetical protein